MRVNPVRPDWVDSTNYPYELMSQLKVRSPKESNFLETYLVDPLNIGNFEQ